METVNMVPVKDAIATATKYFGELYQGMQFTNVRLEEVELSTDENSWLITLGYDDESRVAPLAREVLKMGGASLAPREYKIIAVSAQTGAVESMKIRKF